MPDINNYVDKLIPLTGMPRTAPQLWILNILGSVPAVDFEHSREFLILVGDVGNNVPTMEILRL